MPKLVLLWTDAAVWLIVAGVLRYVTVVRRRPELRATWRQVFAASAPMASALVLAVFIVIGLLDCVHFRPRIDAHAYESEPISLLDVVLARQRTGREESYSAPLAWRSYNKEAVTTAAGVEHDFARLQFAGQELTHPEQQWIPDLVVKTLVGALLGAGGGFTLYLWCAAALAARDGTGLRDALRSMAAREQTWPWRTIAATLVILGMLCGAVGLLASGYHVFGTDSIGNDVFYRVMKSIRTALVMGSLTTAAILPFALILGVLSGYLKGWVDDLIQYFYTTISSVPSVLLIAACVLLIQVFIDKNPDAFPTGIERADVKLLFLCLIIGITEFATMCRLIRGETLKLAELDYVQAAQAFGASSVSIMRRHIVPNVMHLVIISLVLEFSGIVLYEAVLSYVGVGVDPSTSSFGTLINLARSEMSIDPPVWWNLASAFTFMLALVLAVNLFADGVRDAFDPRARRIRVRRVRPAKGRPAARAVGNEA